LNARGANEFWQTEMHTAEPLVPEQNVFEYEMAAEKLKRKKSPVIDQIPAQLITAMGGTILSEIHDVVHSIWNKEGFLTRWKESINVPIFKKGNKTHCSN
jgi:regulator of sirC expression with transglutaminase-like and TPR domain